MTQSSNRRFFRFSRDRQAKKTAPSPSTLNGEGALGSPTLADPVVIELQQDQDNVHGWLMNVPGYREDTTNSSSRQHVYSDGHESFDIVDADNNRITTDRGRPQLGRPASISSISSTDSVNLDDLIKNNYTEQVDDETDLLNLADLDIDDSTDDFWKMDDALASFSPAYTASKQIGSAAVTRIEAVSATTAGRPRNNDDILSMDEQFHGMLNTNDDEVMNWSPEVDHLETASVASYASSRTAYQHSRLRAPSALSSSSRYSATSSPESRLMRQRSDSLSSENSMTSESTVTQQYSRFGMTSGLHPSESTTSNSSRSHSRLSDYSASSSVASSNTASALPRPRAGSKGGSPSVGGSNSHLPLTSQNGTGTSSSRRLGGEKNPSEFLRSSSRIGSSSQSRLAKRATHVPLPSTRNAPKPQVVTSSKSTGLSTSRLGNLIAPSNGVVSRPGSRISGLRASHIPSPRSLASPEPSGTSRSPSLKPARNFRPQSPYNNNSNNTTITSSSRMGGLRSPTPSHGSSNGSGGGNSNSIFGGNYNSISSSSTSDSGFDGIRRSTAREPSDVNRAGSGGGNAAEASRIARPGSAASTKASALRAPMGRLTSIRRPA